jgi:hypothetical protein
VTPRDKSFPCLQRDTGFLQNHNKPPGLKHHSKGAQREYLSSQNSLAKRSEYPLYSVAS